MVRFPFTFKSPVLLVSDTTVPLTGSPSLVIIELPSGPITIDIILAPSINSIDPDAGIILILFAIVYFIINIIFIL